MYSSIPMDFLIFLFRENICRYAVYKRHIYPYPFLVNPGWMGAACFNKVLIENTGDDTYALWGADADPKDKRPTFRPSRRVGFLNDVYFFGTYLLFRMAWIHPAIDVMLIETLYSVNVSSRTNGGETATVAEMDTTLDIDNSENEAAWMLCSRV